MYLTAEFQWLFREEAHDNREFSCENSKPRHDPHGRLVWLLKFTDGKQWKLADTKYSNHQK